MSGRFRQGQNFTNNNGNQTFTYLVSTNTEGSSVTEGANATGFATGSLNWLQVTIADDDSTNDAGLDWPNIDTIGFNPVTLREAWTSGGGSSIDLHTLGSERVTAIYNQPIDRSWYERNGRSEPLNTGDVLTNTADGIEFAPLTLAQIPHVPVIDLGSSQTLRPGQIGQGNTIGEWYINTSISDVTTTIAGARAGDLTAFPGASPEDEASRVDQFGTIRSQVVPTGFSFTFGGATLTNVISVLTLRHVFLNATRNYYSVFTRSAAGDVDQYFYRFVPGVDDDQPTLDTDTNRRDPFYSTRLVDN